MAESPEPATDAEVVRLGYAHFNDGDLGWMLGRMHPGIVWQDASEMPDSRTYQGVPEVRRFLSSFQRHWDELRFEPAEVRDVEGGAVAFCRLVGRGRTSGAHVEARVVHAYEMRDRRVERVRTYLNARQAKRATGLEGPPGFWATLPRPR